MVAGATLNPPEAKKKPRRSRGFFDADERRQGDGARDAYSAATTLTVLRLSLPLVAKTILPSTSANRV